MLVVYEYPLFLMVMLHNYIVKQRDGCLVNSSFGCQTGYSRTPGVKQAGKANRPLWIRAGITSHTSSLGLMKLPRSVDRLVRSVTSLPISNSGTDAGQSSSNILHLKRKKHITSMLILLLKAIEKYVYVPEPNEGWMSDRYAVDTKHLSAQ